MFETETGAARRVVASTHDARAAPYRASCVVSTAQPARTVARQQRHSLQRRPLSTEQPVMALEARAGTLRQRVLPRVNIAALAAAGSALV